MQDQVIGKRTEGMEEGRSSATDEEEELRKVVGLEMHVGG